MPQFTHEWSSDAGKLNTPDTLTDKLIASTAPRLQEMQRYVKDTYKENRVMDLERPKTSEELQFLNDVNHALETFFRNTFDLPSKNISDQCIHFIDEDALSENHKKELQQLFGNSDARHATYDFTHQDVLVRGNGSNLVQASCVVHEMIHAHGFLTKYERRSKEISDEHPEDVVFTTGRTGVYVRGQKQRDWTRELEEAIVTKLTRQFREQYFAKMQYTQNAWNERQKTLKDAGMSEMEIQTVCDVEKPSNSRLQICKDGYEREEAWLDQLLSDIQRKDPTRYPTTQDAFNGVVRSRQAPNLRPLVSMLKEVYGDEWLHQVEQKEAKNHTNNTLKQDISQKSNNNFVDPHMVEDQPYRNPFAPVRVVKMDGSIAYV